MPAFAIPSLLFHFAIPLCYSSYGSRTTLFPYSLEHSYQITNTRSLLPRSTIHDMYSIKRLPTGTHHLYQSSLEPITYTPIPYSLFPAPYSLFPYSLFPAPSSLLPAPCSLLPAPCSQLPAPSSLFPTPYSLFPISCSLFPVPYSQFPISCNPLCPSFLAPLNTNTYTSIMNIVVQCASQLARYRRRPLHLQHTLL